MPSAHYWLKRRSDACQPQKYTSAPCRGCQFYLFLAPNVTAENKALLSSKVVRVKGNRETVGKKGRTVAYNRLVISPQGGLVESAILWVEALKSALFGVVEGYYQWLPSSSTGHMLLLNQFYHSMSPEDFGICSNGLFSLAQFCSVADFPAQSPSLKKIQDERATWKLLGKSGGQLRSCCNNWPAAQRLRETSWEAPLLLQQLLFYTASSLSCLSSREGRCNSKVRSRAT